MYNNNDTVLYVINQEHMQTYTALLICNWLTTIYYNVQAKHTLQQDTKSSMG